MRWICCLLFWGLLAAGPAGAAEPSRPDDIVDLSQVIPSAVYDIRYYTPHNFVGAPVEGYEAPKCLLTKKAASALAGVQAELAKFNLSIKIYDCYRPQRAVNHFKRWAKDIEDTKTKKEFYPTVNKADLFKLGYVAEKSSHSRGSTVDLTIVPIPTPAQPAYVPGQPLAECFLPAKKRFKDNSIDMGAGFDCFHVRSHTENPDVGLEQRINRALLKTIMAKHGFKGIDEEWWHYTLADEPYPDTYFDFPVK